MLVVSLLMLLTPIAAATEPVDAGSGSLAYLAVIPTGNTTVVTVIVFPWPRDAGAQVLWDGEVAYEGTPGAPFLVRRELDWASGERALDIVWSAGGGGGRFVGVYSRDGVRVESGPWFDGVADDVEPERARTVAAPPTLAGAFAASMAVAGLRWRQGFARRRA